MRLGVIPGGILVHLAVQDHIEVAGNLFQWHLECVSLARRNSRFAAAGGKYTLPSTRTIPFTGASAIT